jgi:hypothetical protein
MRVNPILPLSLTNLLVSLFLCKHIIGPAPLSEVPVNLNSESFFLAKTFAKLKGYLTRGGSLVKSELQGYFLWNLDLAGFRI